MVCWDFILKDAGGAELGVLPATGRIVNRYLSLPGVAGCNLKLKYLDSDVQDLVDSVDPYRTRVLVKRAGKPVFLGEIQEPQETLSADSETFTIPIIGLLSLFDDRYTDDVKTYSGDQGSIAWGLIGDTQAKGSFGITQGATTTGILRNRSYEVKRVSDAIKELAACDNGFDFDFSPTGVFSTFCPAKGVYVRDYEFVWGKNIEHIERTWLKPFNVVRALGAGEGSNMLRTTVSDAQSIALYGMREIILNLKDVAEQATLEQRALDYLSQYRFPVPVLKLKIRPSADPGWGAYDVGDYVRAKVDHGRMQLDCNVRILGIETTISDEDKEEVTLVTNT